MKTVREENYVSCKARLILPCLSKPALSDLQLSVVSDISSMALILPLCLDGRFDRPTLYSAFEECKHQASMKRTGRLLY